LEYEKAVVIKSLEIPLAVGSRNDDPNTLQRPKDKVKKIWRGLRDKNSKA
jgi:hypothetical protein